MGILADVGKLLPHILPPGLAASDQDLARWRGLIATFVLVTAILFAWFLGAFPFSAGVAFADDIDRKIDQAIMQAVGPVTARLTSIEGDVADNGLYLKILVKSDLREQIDRMIRARCEVDGTDQHAADQKELFNKAIDNYQRQFNAVAGHQYDEPSCEEL